MSGETITTTCAIAGGGPAGMMLGYLLARAGVDVVVLEKHADFLRDFRGDTIHPSTLEVMHELGLYERLLQRPYQPTPKLKGRFGTLEAVFADFTHLPVRGKFVAFMPQWDFLDFLASHAKRYANFCLLMETEVTGLQENRGTVVGVAAKTSRGAMAIHADLTVGADGRHSIVREKADLARDDFGVPIDVLWMRLSKKTSDDSTTLGRIVAGVLFVTLDRGDYWQCALVIPKGAAEDLRARGLDAFRQAIVRVAPAFADRVKELQSWDQVKLLTVTIDRLRQWAKPGLLCIGDCAHAMSPIGGVGINLAVQDAVAAANILAERLRSGAASLDLLGKVQKRREWPTRMTQNLQIAIQNTVMARVLMLTHEPKPPLAVKLLNWVPYLRRIPARLVGVGFRPEHVHTPEFAKPL
jgi:2-polyprenyl-6-methoxyphenol hydroxylase-like FAD-dependent oxidoreductase